MLTIQRQFSLPNCILILEGLSTESNSAPRPLLSTLTRFECHFGNESQKIEGGRELLNVLAQRVHVQAQSLLSGVKGKPQHTIDESKGLKLETSGGSQYSLAIDSSLLEESSAKNSDGVNLKLNSVQLFDLVEAFDQLMEDTQTLPDLSLKLKPLSKKEALAENGAAQKFIPISIGIASLALIAGVSFVLPTPDITKPTAPVEEETTESVIETDSSPEGSAEPNVSPEPDTSSEEASEAAETAAE